MPTARSRKIKQRTDPATKLARSFAANGIIPAHQAQRGAFTQVDVQNHSDADQRRTVRSGETRTLKRKPKLHKLFDAKVLTLAQVMNCQWYINKHAAGFDTVGITANYGGAGGGGCDAFTHLARNRAQANARHEYAQARASISPMLIHLFEKVVLHDGPVGRLGISFRTAVEQLGRHLAEIGEAA